MELEEFLCEIWKFHIWNSKFSHLYVKVELEHFTCENSMVKS